MGVKLFMSLLIISSFVIAHSLIDGLEGSVEICMRDEDCLYGTCNGIEGQGFCECFGRWTGLLCNESLYCQQPGACSNNGVCNPGSSAEEDFVCDCNSLSSGTECNLGQCIEITEPNPYTGEFVTFRPVNQNEVSLSNITCEGGFFGGDPVGTKKCGSDAEWETTVWIANCSASSLDDLDLENGIFALQIASSDLTSADENEVGGLVQSYSDFSSSTTNPNLVSSLISTANNIIQIEDENSLGNSVAIREGLRTMADNVVFESTLDNINLFESIETDVAVIAVTDNETAVSRADGTSQYVIALIDELQNEDGLRAASFNYNFTTDPTMFQTFPMYAVVHSDTRMSFELFSDARLFFPNQNDGDVRVESLVMRVGPQTVSESLQFKFYLNQFYGNVNPTGFDAESNRTFYCGSWSESESSWNDQDCSDIVVFNSDLYNFVTCTCTSSGYYTVLSRAVAGPGGDPNNPGGDDGLSGGEIAGIVVGSVAGAVLIFGGIGYFVNKNKKKKSMTTKVIPLETKKNYSSSFDEEMQHISDSRRSSSDKQE